MGGEEDQRFAHVGRDPRFRSMGRKERKVKIDKRFEAMFNDKKFKLKYTVDKRGRPIQTTTNENLRKFYDLSESESEEDDEDVVSKKNKKKDKRLKKEKVARSEVKSSSKNEKKSKKSEEEVEEKKSRKEITDESSEDVGSSGIEEDEKANDSIESAEDENVEDEKASDSENADNSSDGDDENEEDDDSDSDSDDSASVDLARGEGNLSSSDDDDDEYEFDDGKFDHKWAELDKGATEVSEVTSRLAVCNMDWDRIKAQDILMLFNSFKPTGGIINKISIYISEYGKERLAEENLKGPKELVEHANEDENDAEGSKYQMEKLRQYQLNRLKYYYAVMECDSPETANHIYEQCEGLEYESSSTRIDLRFIPDDMEFSDKPTSQITDMPDAVAYKPTLFNCKALNQSQVELTWDETDTRRKELLMRKFNKDDIEEMDMKDYLASSSSDEEDPYAGIEVADFLKPAEGKEDEENDSKGKKDKYKDILSIAKDNKDTVQDGDMEMEITFEPGLKEATEDLIEKKNKKKSQTPWDEYLDKKKEKRDKRKKKYKNESKAMATESDNEGEGISEDELPAGIDLNDPYFKEEIDRMDEEDGDERPKNEGKKKKKKHKKNGNEEEGQEDKQEQAALSLLMMDEDDDKQHFSLEGIQEREKLESKKKKKRRNKKKLLEQQVQDNFEINVNDPRFTSIYDNPVYNIDPSAPEYKATKSMSVLAKEKVKRRQDSDKRGNTKSNESSKRKIDDETNKASGSDSLANLVKSVKVKTKNIQSKKARFK